MDVKQKGDRSMQGNEKRDEMLDKLGITDSDFRDYLKKLRGFLDSLKSSQREFHYEHCGTETIEELQEAFGRNMTAEDIEALFVECPPIEGVCFVRCCRLIDTLL
jgi:hypothetical protein